MDDSHALPSCNRRVAHHLLFTASIRFDRKGKPETQLPPSGAFVD